MSKFTTRIIKYPKLQKLSNSTGELKVTKKVFIEIF